MTAVVYEGPAPEDEAWDNTDKPEWFYSVKFRQQDLWPDYPDLYANDTVETEFSERWLRRHSRLTDTEQRGQANVRPTTRT